MLYKDLFPDTTTFIELVNHKIKEYNEDVVPDWLNDENRYLKNNFLCELLYNRYAYRILRFQKEEFLHYFINVYVENTPTLILQQAIFVGDSLFTIFANNTKLFTQSTARTKTGDISDSTTGTIDNDSANTPEYSSGEATETPDITIKKGDTIRQKIKNIETYNKTIATKFDNLKTQLLSYNLDSEKIIKNINQTSINMGLNDYLEKFSELFRIYFSHPLENIVQ